MVEHNIKRMNIQDDDEEKGCKCNKDKVCVSVFKEKINSDNLPVIKFKILNTQMSKILENDPSNFDKTR